MRMSISTTSGRRLRASVHGVAAVAASPTNADARLRLEDRPEPRPDQRLVVRDQDRDRVAHVSGP